MSDFQEKSTFQGRSVYFTWIGDKDINEYEPITQVYGVISNDNEEVLIAREAKKSGWIIPGGRPRKEEGLKEALERELEEEVDVVAKDLRPIGVQKVYFPNNPNKKDGETFYQARFVGVLDKLNSQTPDPASGNVWERKLVPLSEVDSYVKWGKTGQAMFAVALKFYKKI